MIADDEVIVTDPELVWEVLLKLMAQVTGRLGLRFVSTTLDFSAGVW